MPVPALEVLWLRPEARPIRTSVHARSLIYGFSSLPPATGSLVVVARATSDPLTDARSVTIEAGQGGALNWAVGAGVQDLRFSVLDRDRAECSFAYRTLPDGPFEHVPEPLDGASYRILTRAARVDLQARTRSEVGKRLGVIEDLGKSELFELGPEGIVRAH